MSDAMNDVTACSGTSLPLGPIPHGGQVHLQILVEQFEHSAEQHAYVLVVRPNESDPHAPFRLTVKPYIHHNPPPPPPETEKQRRFRLVTEALQRTQGLTGPNLHNTAAYVMEALAGEFVEDCELPHEIEGA